MHGYRTALANLQLNLIFRNLLAPDNTFFVVHAYICIRAKAGKKYRFFMRHPTKWNGGDVGMKKATASKGIKRLFAL